MPKRKRSSTKSTGSRKMTSYYKSKKKSSGKKSFGKSKFSKKSSSKKLSSLAKKIGTAHWLSYGKGVQGSRPKFAIKKTSGVGTYNLTTKGTLVSSNNQGTSTLCELYTSAQILQCAASTFANAFVAGTQTATAYSGPISAGTVANKVFLDTCISKTTLVNQSNAACFIDIYNIVSRRDMAGTSYDTPVEVWTKGYIDGGGVFDPGNLGVTPFSSGLFCQMFKVLGKTHLNLAAGETAEHVIKSSPKKVFDVGFANVSSLIRGLTQFALIVIKGSPSDANNSTVGITSAKVDWINCQEFRTYGIIDGRNYGINTQTSLTSTGQYITVVGSGTATAEADA